ncbi:MAG: hypothetical protein CL844_03640 [Crocinitomicaceae bacterium]|nr:hypothetical protein [Crocinitomicaceae bacterium]
MPVGREGVAKGAATVAARQQPRDGAQAGGAGHLVVVVARAPPAGEHRRLLLALHALRGRLRLDELLALLSAAALGLVAEASYALAERHVARAAKAAQDEDRHDDQNEREVPDDELYGHHGARPRLRACVY